MQSYLFSLLCVASLSLVFNVGAFRPQKRYQVHALVGLCSWGPGPWLLKANVKTALCGEVEWAEQEKFKIPKSVNLSYVLAVRHFLLYTELIEDLTQFPPIGYLVTPD